MKKLIFLIPAVLILAGAGCNSQDKEFEQQKVRIRDLEQQVGTLIEQGTEKKEEPVIMQKESSAEDRIADYLERQEQEKKQAELIANCEKSAELTALLESRNSDAVVPTQCQQYNTDLGKIYQGKMAAIPDCSNSADPYCSLKSRGVESVYADALDYWSEQVKLYNDCVYQFIYAQEYVKCINR